MRLVDRFVRRLVLAAIAFAPLSAGAQFSVRDFDAYVAKGMRDWEVPGVAVGVVRNDSVLLLRGYGVRTVGKPGKVDENTLFALASDSKAFTGILLAMLVDDGKLSWDDRVIDRLPAFQLADPWTTREITLRDLITHRSGLSRGDLLWTGGWSYDTQELLRRVRFLKPTWSLRSHYGYSNLMYAAAGEVAKAVTRESWSDLVHERILIPLGMSTTNTTVSVLPSLVNVASPHAKIDDTIRVVSYTNADQIPAAGAINSTASDMVRWLRFQLDSGRVGGKRLVSARNFRETHTPQTVIRIDSAYRAMNPFTHLQSYAFGWTVSDYRGHEMLRHAGNLSGMAAMVGLLPEEKAGVVVLTNLEGNALRESLMYKAFDMILAAEPKDWSTENLVEARGLEAAARERERRREQSRVRGTHPSLPLEQYAGGYEDPLYGTSSVSVINGHLVLQLSAETAGDLEHWNYDTFRIVWRDHRDGKALVSFILDPMGKVSEMRFDPDGGIAEETPDFKRVRTGEK